MSEPTPSADGGGTGARRKQFQRARDRVALELGLDEADDE
jgi:predicted nucleotide-binding protein